MPRKPTIGDKIAYYALLIFEKPFGLMPTSWMWHIGAGLGYIAHKFAKKRKAIVQANLKIVHPDFSEEQIDTLTKEVFRKSFANLASSINTGFVSSKRIDKIASITGQENIRNLNPDRGCIMLLFHMGNWEILGRIAPMLDSDKPSGCMFRPLNNQYINDHITRSREKGGTRLFGRKRGLIEAHKFVKAGGMLGILGDQYSGKAGVQLPLFGKETSITPLPAILAQKYDCPIVPVVIKTVAPGKWILDFQSPFNIPTGLDKIEATKLLIPVMESIMKDHCSDIFWLHDRWKIKRELQA